MKLILICALFFTVLTFSGKAQNDSIPQNISEKKVFYKQQILPAGLIVTGSLLNIGTIKNKIQDKIPDTGNSIDDYIQYVPMGQMYLFDALGFKHQNTVFNQTKYLLISQLITSATVHLTKNITQIERPNGNPTSFPSGHTGNAFCGATVLFHEFKDTEPLLAYSGYVFATATGVLRMTNNAHWLPDVMVGAGIGILATNLVYYLKPFESFQLFKKKKDLSFIPLISPNSLGFSCRF